MSQGRPPDNDELQELVRRMEREFQARGRLPEDVTPAEAAEVMERAESGPQRTRLSLPLSPPRVVYLLLTVNVLMYGITLMLAAYADSFGRALQFLGWKENDLINAGQWWRLLTPMVLHGSIPHLLFNSFALYSLGREAESVYGTVRFVAVYLIAGLAGSIASYVFNPLVPSVGASGAIFGLFGALGAFALTSRSLIGAEAARMQLTQIGSIVVINLFLGLAVPNIDNSAHIGGLIAGGLAGLGLAPRYAMDRHGYVPALERRDNPLVGWLVAGLLLLGLVALFLVARPG